MLLAFAVVWVMYFLTLAPELTLEDSGELVTGSYYAGIPHPPGYPVWTIYSWLWTVLVPWGNPAWRVALAEAFLGALACGLLSLMVSRGSSMLMEGVEELKGMTGKWENAICMVSGFSAGLLLGLDGFMWRESVAVNRIAVSSVPWFLIVLACILRWLYAPHQHRYIYWALFVFGICFTTHQSLIVAAIGVQVAIAAGNQRIGRDVFFGNFIIYMLANLYQVASAQPVFGNLAKPGLQLIFHGVGVGSLAASIWLSIITKTKGVEIGRNMVFLAVLGGAELALMNLADNVWFPIYALGTLAAVGYAIYLCVKTWKLGHEWLVVFNLGMLWIVGFSFYFFMPVSGMTNPPMQWGYPREVEGFFHALSRGQYEQPNPTNVVAEPVRFASQLWLLVQGLAAEFGWVYMFIAIVPFLFFFKYQKRERAWLIGLSAIYLCLGVLLVILLNPTYDRAAADLVKVFFCNSHTIVALLIGYGLALTAAYMATHYQRFRPWGLAGGAVGLLLGIYCLYEATGRTFFGRDGVVPLGEWPYWIGKAFAKNTLGLPVFGNMVLVFVPLVFLVALLVYRQRGPLFITLGLFLMMPLYSGLAHWYGSNQHEHMFGYWFGHEMFTPSFTGKDGKPIYSQMTKDSVLYGGTDPGRFCPTYMIFCESFTPHNCQPLEDQKFDRRDVYIITQNALADGTYLEYIRAHYNRSKQIDRPFFQDLLRPSKERELNYTTNLLARIVAPLDTIFEGIGARVEKRRRTYTSWFTENDFTNVLALTARLRARSDQDPLSQYLVENFSAPTRQLVEANADTLALRRGLAKDLNVLMERELVVKQRLEDLREQKNALSAKAGSGSSPRLQEVEKQIAELEKIGPLYTPARFQQVRIDEYLHDFIKENPQSSTRIRLNRLLLEAAYPDAIARSLGGVYPDREIYIASVPDSQKCFNDYMVDAQRRLQLNQLKPGEDVRFDSNSGRVTVAGQVAVMAINGLLTKVMFDANTNNDFYVEESFPLDWMYPHLTPYGVIMKVNRQPLPSLSDDVLERDHEFWKQFSKRLTGDFIDYDTPIKEITDWIEKVYIRHDFNGFTGDRKFIFDDDGQKAFSKLRSSIGGIYSWRLSQAPPEYQPRTQAERERLQKEAEFTFKQAFAFCPYSPEALYRYVIGLLLPAGRISDALLLVESCLKLDPYNGQVIQLRDNLRSYQRQQPAAAVSAPPPQPGRGPTMVPLSPQQLEAELQTNPSNFQVALQLASYYHQMRQPARTVQLLEGLVTNPAAPLGALAQASQMFNEMQDWTNLERSLDRMVAVAPIGSPEAWYNLAAARAMLGKNPEAVAALSQAVVQSNERRKSDTNAPDLAAEARKTNAFPTLRSMPEFQKLVASP